MARVFVIRPFAKKKDSLGKVLDFERVHQELIDPTLKAANLSGSTTGEILVAGNIREDMFSLILEADLVICDITIHNANVFYELGIRHALRKKHTILIRGVGTADETPFDLQTDRYLSYDLDNPASAHDQLLRMIHSTLRDFRETDSPVFRLLPDLLEADPSTVTILPMDFQEEVERASAARSMGWLRLLAQDLQGRRFHRLGLQQVATIQWRLKDYEGARKSWETIQTLHGDPVTTRLALANIYERLYRETAKPELLKASDQAIDQILASKDAPITIRVEALTLKGRNRKTQWRLAFKDLATVEERRAAAMNQALRACYETYRKAFYQDLNHFYSGLAALQMATIFLSLLEEGDDSWKYSFDTDREARIYKLKLMKDVKSLRLLVSAALEASVEQSSRSDSDQVWATISKADLLFLMEPNDQRVIRRYKDVLPKDDPFAWDAARGQLQLFADLGIKPDRANAVIDTVEGQHARQNAEISEVHPLHIILFAGHRVDAPGRPEKRFPPEQEECARQLIRDLLSKVDRDHRLMGFASAAPGGDILFHELCDELHIPHILCLPMPAAEYAHQEFKDLDHWRSRFLRLLQTKSEVLELSHREGLPNWLHGAETNPWERGNFWVLQMALTSRAELVTLIALWDGKNEGDGPGGTANMVQIARDAGKIRIEIIDANLLKS